MNTEDRILDACRNLIQERGYHGFSFADIAKDVGIRKASIYYYFPAKAELGQKTVSRYRDSMRAMREDWAEAERLDVLAALNTYMEPIVALGQTPGASCLCGVLGGEFQSLPPIVQNEVSNFFEEHLQTLSRLFEIGRDKGIFQFEGDPRVLAKVAFSMIEGSMLIKRTRGDTDVFGEVIMNLRTVLGIRSSL
jgi:TetR/AcrR family transcriptional repressor of nem operon